MYVINEIPGAAARKKGHATYPDDFPHLSKLPGQDFTAWRIGADWHIETTLNGDALLEKLKTLSNMDEN